VQEPRLLRGCLKGGKEGSRIITASVRLAGSYRPSGSKREKATGDLDVNLARDRRDINNASPAMTANSCRTKARRANVNFPVDSDQLRPLGPAYVLW